MSFCLLRPLTFIRPMTFFVLQFAAQGRINLRLVWVRVLWSNPPLINTHMLTAESCFLVFLYLEYFFKKSTYSDNTSDKQHKTNQQLKVFVFMGYISH